MSSTLRPATARAETLLQALAAAAARTARKARCLAAAIVAASALAACSAVDSIIPETYSDLPESPEVETAPYPRLIDSPTTVAKSDVEANAAKGQAIRSDIETEAAELAEAEAAMRARPIVTDTGIAAEAAALSAEGRKIDAQ